MNKINLIPQVGVLIEGIGQVNFGDSREKLLQTWGQNDDDIREKRLRFKNYGCFVDFKKSDDTFEAIEFWNDLKENLSQVFIYNTEVLQGNATSVKIILQEKNNNEGAEEGWFVNIDVIYSGGDQKNMLDYIEECKKEGQFKGIAKEQMLLDLEEAKYFTSFGIGYKGYCRDGLEELEKILNGK